MSATRLAAKAASAREPCTSLNIARRMLGCEVPFAPCGETDGRRIEAVDSVRRVAVTGREAAGCVRHAVAHRIGVPGRRADQAQTGQQVGQDAGAIFDADDLADLEGCLAEVAHHDPMVGFALDGDHDLAAIGQITGLGIVVQRHRHERAGIERLEETEDLEQDRLGPLGEAPQLLHRVVAEADPREPQAHSASRSIPNSAAARGSSMVGATWRSRTSRR
jgi:hypothetical protein